MLILCHIYPIYVLYFRFHQQVPKPGQIDALEPLSMSRLVELSVVAPSGSETVADDMRTFAEQLKPYPLYCELCSFVSCVVAITSTVWLFLMFGLLSNTLSNLNK